MPDALDDLIQKLEAATEGGGRELDHALRAIHKPATRAELHYTTSLDAALKLVPRGWSWRVGNLPSGRGFASLGTQRSLQDIVGAAPALALCIAALRTRAGQ